MIEKLEKLTDDMLKFCDKYDKYIISFSFVIVIVGCGLWQLKIYNISSIFSLIGMLIIAILGFIIILIVETIKKIKRR